MLRLTVALLLALTLVTALILASALAVGMIGRAPMLAYVGEDAGSRDLYLIEPRSRLSVRLTRHPSADLNPVWSPDGRHLAFYSLREGQIMRVFVMTLPAGEVRRVTPLEMRGMVSGLAWSDDGRWLLFIHQEGITADLHHADPTLADADAYLGVLDTDHPAAQHYLSAFEHRQRASAADQPIYFDMIDDTDWGLFHWPPAAEAPRLVHALGPGTTPSTLALSPAGDRLAFAVIPRMLPPRLYVLLLDADGSPAGAPHRLTAGSSPAWRP